MSVLRGRKEVELEAKKKKEERRRKKRKTTIKRQIKEKSNKHPFKREPPHYKLNYNDLRDQKRRRSEEGR